MYYEVLDIAKYVVNYCNKVKGEPISNWQLQSVMYFLWVDYFKKTQERIFDDLIFARKSGAITQVVYDEFCVWGGLPISPSDKYRCNITLGGDVDNIIDRYRKLDAFDLADMVRRKGRPWDVTVKEYGYNYVIDFDLIEELECKKEPECKRTKWRKFLGI